MCTMGKIFSGTTRRRLQGKHLILFELSVVTLWIIQSLWFQPERYTLEEYTYAALSAGQVSAAQWYSHILQSLQPLFFDGLNWFHPHHFLFQYITFQLSPGGDPATILATTIYLNVFFTAVAFLLLPRLFTALSPRDIKVPPWALYIPALAFLFSRGSLRIGTGGEVYAGVLLFSMAAWLSVAHRRFWPAFFFLTLAALWHVLAVLQGPALVWLYHHRLKQEGNKRKPVEKSGRATIFRETPWSVPPLWKAPLRLAFFSGAVFFGVILVVAFGFFDNPATRFFDYLFLYFQTAWSDFRQSGLGVLQQIRFFSANYFYLWFPFGVAKEASVTTAVFGMVLLIAPLLAHYRNTARAAAIRQCRPAPTGPLVLAYLSQMVFLFFWAPTSRDYTWLLQPWALLLLTIAPVWGIYHRKQHSRLLVRLNREWGRYHKLTGVSPEHSNFFPEERSRAGGHITNRYWKLGADWPPGLKEQLLRAFSQWYHSRPGGGPAPIPEFRPGRRFYPPGLLLTMRGIRREIAVLGPPVKESPALVANTYQATRNSRQFSVLWQTWANQLRQLTREFLHRLARRPGSPGTKNSKYFYRWLYRTAGLVLILFALWDGGQWVRFDSARPLRIETIGNFISPRKIIRPLRADYGKFLQTTAPPDKVTGQVHWAREIWLDPGSLDILFLPRIQKAIRSGGLRAGVFDFSSFHPAREWKSADGLIRIADSVRRNQWERLGITGINLDLDRYAFWGWQMSVLRKLVTPAEKGKPSVVVTRQYPWPFIKDRLSSGDLARRIRSAAGTRGPLAAKMRERWERKRGPYGNLDRLISWLRYPPGKNSPPREFSLRRHERPAGLFPVSMDHFNTLPRKKVLYVLGFPVQD